MGRTYSRKRKSLTQAQQNAILRAREAQALQSTTHKNIQALLALRKTSQEASCQDAAIAIYQLKAKNAATKFWSARRRVKRMEEANKIHKAKLKQLQGENKKLAQDAETWRKTSVNANKALKDLYQQVTRLTEERRELRQDRSSLNKKVVRLQKMKTIIRDRLH